MDYALGIFLLITGLLFGGLAATDASRSSLLKDCASIGAVRVGDVVIKCEVKKGKTNE